MISEKQIRKLAEEGLAKDAFVVDILVSTDNRIHVFIDSDDQVSVADCIRISRAIEGNLDRETEDFELQVSSAGLDQPFRMPRQYKKYIGRKVDIQMNDESKMSGILVSAEDDHLVIKELIKKGKHKKEEEGPEEKILLSEIKATKPGIQFKK